MTNSKSLKDGDIEKLLRDAFAELSELDEADYPDHKSYYADIDNTIRAIANTIKQSLLEVVPKKDKTALRLFKSGEIAYSELRHAEGYNQCVKQITDNIEELVK